MAVKHQKFNYFDGFEKQVDLACKEARLLIEILENYDPEDLLSKVDQAHAIEHEGDLICHDMFTAVGLDFITPIEREDIIHMSDALDEIMDIMEGIVQRFYMMNVREVKPGAVEFAHLLLKSCETLKAAMQDFRNFKNSKKLRQLIIDVCDVEEECDALFFRLQRELFTECTDPVDILRWNFVYQRLEDTADACETVADTMGSIMLKNA